MNIMNIAILILKTALELLKLISELGSKLVTPLRRWARSRRSARQQRAQGVGRVPQREPRWLASRLPRRSSFAGIDRTAVAIAADDGLLHPVPEQQPLAAYTTRPVLTKDLIRR